MSRETVLSLSSLWWTITGLSSGQGSRRAYAYGRLAEWRGVKAVPYLLRKLKREEPSVKTFIMGDLARLGDPRAVEPLQGLLRDEHPSVRQAALRALGNMKATAAVPAILGSLNDEDWTLREMALQVLGMLGGSSAIPRIAKCLQDRVYNVRLAAVRALDTLGWKPSNDAERAFLHVARREWEEAVKVGQAAVEPLLYELNHKDENVQRAAAVALGRIGEYTGVHWAAQRFEKGDRWKRKEAVGLLGLMCNRDAIPILLKVLDSPDEEIRCAAVEALAQAAGMSAVEHIVRAGGDKHRWVRMSAARALLGLGSSNAVQGLKPFCPGGAGQQLVDDLCQRLRRDPAAFPEGDLRALADFPRVCEVWISPYDGDPDIPEDFGHLQEIKCSSVRELARAELARRQREDAVRNPSRSGPFTEPR
jgi:HEAT repeat protein